MARRGYVQLVNGFYANEKVQELARSGRMDAVGAFCMALTYCGDHLTDGFVPRHALCHRRHGRAGQRTVRCRNARSG